jgi:hypothetical protein
LTFEAEDRFVPDHADIDAFAVEYIAVHDQPPIEVPTARLRLLGGDSEAQIAGLAIPQTKDRPEAVSLRGFALSNISR